MLSTTLLYRNLGAGVNLLSPALPIPHSLASKRGALVLMCCRSNDKCSDVSQFPALAELGFHILIGFLVVGETQVLTVP